MIMSIRLPLTFILALTSACWPDEDPHPIDTTCVVTVDRIDEGTFDAWRVPITVTHVRIPLYAAFPTELTCWLIPDNSGTAEIFRRVVSGADEVATAVDGGGATIQCDGGQKFVEFYGPEIACLNDSP